MGDVARASAETLDALVNRARELAPRATSGADRVVQVTFFDIVSSACCGTGPDSRCSRSR